MVQFQCYDYKIEHADKPGRQHCLRLYEFQKVWCHEDYSKCSGKHYNLTDYHREGDCPLQHWPVPCHSAVRNFRKIGHEHGIRDARYYCSELCQKAIRADCRQREEKADDENSHLVHGIGSDKIDSEFLGIEPNDGEGFPDIFAGDCLLCETGFQFGLEVCSVAYISLHEWGDEVGCDYGEEAPAEKQEECAKYQICRFGKYRCLR